MTKIRAISILIFFIAIAAPAAWAFREIQLFNSSNPDSGCALPLLSIYFFAVVGAGGIASVATTLNIIDIYRSAGSTTIARSSELVILALPIAATVLLIGVITLAG